MDGGELRLQNFKSDDERGRFLNKEREALGLPRADRIKSDAEILAELISGSREEVGQDIIDSECA